jgi:dCTP deaminase
MAGSGSIQSRLQDSHHSPNQTARTTRHPSTFGLVRESRISIPKEGAYSFDLRKGGIAKFLADNCEHFDIDERRPHLFERDTFILAQTREVVEFPLDKGEPVLAARIEGRSSVARCGVLVHFTAPTVHADYKGTLTLEMRNLGPAAFVLYPGMPICQLIIEEVRGMPVKNPSQFQGQKTPSGR